MSGLRERWLWGVPFLFAAAGCTDAVPTTTDGSRVPVQAETVEVRLAFSEFATDFAEQGGYGRPSRLPGITIAHEWEGELESRQLVRFGRFPASVNAIPSGGGAMQADSAYVPVGGRLVLRVDTLQVLGDPPFEFQANAILTEWDPASATWELAVDTLGGSIPWGEAGAGPVRPIGSGSWFPTVSETGTIDSLSIEIDSLTAAEWAMEGSLSTGLRLDGLTTGTRQRILRTDLRLRARPSINPDTIVEVSVGSAARTVVYSPGPGADPSAFQIGGFPANRATFTLDLPGTLDLSAEECERIECPLVIEPGRIVFAGLVLHSHAALSPGFQPVDSTLFLVHPVLSPDRLPRSPLGLAVGGLGVGLAPEIFSEGSESTTEIGITAFVRNLLSPDSLITGDLSPTVALVANPEPFDLDILSFYAPGTALEPRLRLILTVSEGVSLP